MQVREKGEVKEEKRGASLREEERNKQRGGEVRESKRG